MEYLLVRFADSRDVFVSGVVRGKTNELIEVAAGTHTIALANPGTFEPPSQKVLLQGTTILSPEEITFEVAHTDAKSAAKVKGKQTHAG